MQFGDVRVWLVRPADFGPAGREALVRLLDDDERARLGRLRLDADRHAYGVAHGACRLALGGELGVDPRSLRFCRDAHGKPALQGAASGLHFSLSHTRSLVACAATISGPLGIDVEPVQAMANVDAALLERFVCPPAAGVLPAQPDAAFHACWTALEAYWKARGVGLTPANPRLRLERADEGRLHATLEHDLSGDSRLVVTPIDAGPGVAVALACRWTPTLQRMQLPAPPHERPQKCDKRSLLTCGDLHVAALA